LKENNSAGAIVLTRIVAVLANGLGRMANESDENNFFTIKGCSRAARGALQGMR